MSTKAELQKELDALKAQKAKPQRPPRKIKHREQQLEQLVEQFVVEMVDYMTVNQLGNPEDKHNIKIARSLGIKAGERTPPTARAVQAIGPTAAPGGPPARTDPPNTYDPPPLLGNPLVASNSESAAKHKH